MKSGLGAKLSGMIGEEQHHRYLEEIKQIKDSETKKLEELI
jgi:hypothetical protein